MSSMLLRVLIWAVIVNEVDTFLFQPHLSSRSQYHTVNFLSQIRLTNKGDGPRVAKRLIDVYFGLFKVLITGPSSNQKFDKHGKENPRVKNSEEHSDSHAEMDSRLLWVLLTSLYGFEEGAEQFLVKATNHPTVLETDEDIKVENMIKLNDEFDYKSLSRRIDI